MRRHFWLLIILLAALLAACNGPREPSPPAPGKGAVAAPRPTVAPAAPRPTLTAALPAPEGRVVPIRSIRDETIPFVPAERIVISELFLMRDALRALRERGWDGNPDRPLPLSVEDFDPATLRDYVLDEQADDEALTIPPALEPLYIGEGAAAEMEALILSANDEFVGYLEAMGVLPAYVAELRVVMPASPERMRYVPINDPNSPATRVEGLELSDIEVDHSRLEMSVYPADIYNRALLLERSRILGEPPPDEAARLAYHRTLRDIAARQLIYHEMSHALQRAYTNLHVEKPGDRRASASYLYASKTLFEDVDRRHHWRWGDPFFAESYNFDVSAESQAEGISFEVVTALYDMSEAQRRAVWEHLFGRLDASAAALDEARALFEGDFPRYPPYRFGDQLSDVMAAHPDPASARALRNAAFRLIALPAYVGYLHPMRPEETPSFWAALREE